MQKILAILPFINSPENPLEYLNHSSDRRWELTINWKTKVYLTDNEFHQLLLIALIILLIEWFRNVCNYFKRHIIFVFALQHLTI